MKNLLKILIIILLSVTVATAQHEYDKFRYCNYILDFSQSEPVLDSNDLEILDYSDGFFNPAMITFLSDSNGENTLYLDEKNLEYNNKNIYHEPDKIIRVLYTDLCIIPTRNKNIFYIYNSGSTDLEEQVLLRKISIKDDELSIIEEISIPLKFGEMEVTHHANGKDYWLITANLRNNSLESYHITDKFEYNNPIYSIKLYGLHASTGDSIVMDAGQISISPNSKFIVTKSVSTQPLNGSDLLGFNNQTGEFEYLDKLEKDYQFAEATKLEFFGDSRYIFVIRTSQRKYNNNLYKIHFNDCKYEKLSLIDSLSIKNYIINDTFAGGNQVLPNGNILFSIDSASKSVGANRDKIQFGQVMVRNDKLYYEYFKNLEINFTDRDDNSIILLGKYRPELIDSYMDMNVIEACEGDDINLNSDECRIFDGTGYKWELLRLDSENPQLEAEIKQKLLELEGTQFPILENVTPGYSGNYYIRYTDNDTIYRKKHIKLNVYPKPNDNEIVATTVSDSCETLTYLLAPEKVYDDYTYSWNTGDEGPQITVDEEGTYILYATPEFGCMDSTEFVFQDTSQLSLTILSEDKKCFGEPVRLSANQDFESYSWSTGETTKEIVVTEPNTYTLEVVNKNGCVIEDEIKVEYHSQVRAEIDYATTNTCQGDSILLESKYQREYYSYLWRNDNSTSKQIYAKQTGRYTLIIEDTRTGCTDSSYVDIEITDEIEPEILGSEICGNNPTTLTAEPSGTDYEYLWSTGETTQSIEVNNSGTYSVTVTKGNCTGFTEREIEQYPNPEFTIEGNRSICVGETTILSSSKDFAEYLWSTGDITKEIVVDEAGTYSLTVTDENGCSATEEVTVEVNEVDYDMSASSIDYGKIYITETKSETITLTNTSGNEIVLDGTTIPENGTYEINHTLNPETTGPYNETINVNITEPCAETITINITAEIYARVTVRAPEIETQVGATNVPLPITMSAEAALNDKEYDYTIQTLVDGEIYYTEENLTFNNTSTIESNETEIVSYSGTVLLARQLEYPITFGEISFSDPYIEVETIDGQITVDRICVHGTRNVLHSFTEITVNPNPAKDNINIGITTEEEGNISVELISATGASVYTNNINHSSGSDNIQIQTDDIPSGMYQIIIKTKGHIYRKEIVVTK